MTHSRDPGQHRSRTYEAGLAAERSVARMYLRRGCAFRAHRWRGHAGEIDIVFAEGERIVFVEVKKARDFARAAQSLSSRQVARLVKAAEEYVANCPKGSLTEVRFDLALVNAAGEIELVENALAA